MILLLPRAARADSGAVGDLGGDGAVTAADAAVALRAAYGLIRLDNAESITADVTGNMTVGAADAKAMLLLAVGRIGSFADLGQTPGDSLLGEKFIEKFSYTGTVADADEYRSRYVSVTVRPFFEAGASGYVADVYVHGVASLRTAFSGGAYRAKESLETTLQLAVKNGASLAVNGDMYSQRSAGPIVRNGVWYDESIDQREDICVLYTSGEMATFSAGKAGREQIESQGTPWQAFVYGPRLLDDDGKPLKYFAETTASPKHSARTVIGYYEPGHYCFVIVSPRTGDASQGMTFAETAAFMGKLGCKAAYNLAGGTASAMTLCDQPIGASDSARAVSDIVFIAEPAAAGGNP